MLFIFFRSLYKDADKSFYFSTDFKRRIRLWADRLLLYGLAFYGRIFFHSVFPVMFAGAFLNQLHIFTDDRLYLYVDPGKAQSKDLELYCSNLGAGIGRSSFFISMQAAGYDLEDGFLKFAVSREFYYVPFFGWGKLVLSAFLGKEYMGMIIGLALFFAR